MQTRKPFNRTLNVLWGVGLPNAFDVRFSTPCAVVFAPKEVDLTFEDVELFLYFTCGVTHSLSACVASDAGFTTVLDYTEADIYELADEPGTYYSAWSVELVTPIAPARPYYRVWVRLFFM